MNLRELIRKCVACFQIRTRHTRELQNEIARLHEENRGLVNSILGLAGIPPMPRRSAATYALGESLRSGIRQNAKNSFSSAASTLESISALPASDERAVPHRRRSWQQLGRAREIEDARAARRERETDAEAFPAPRNIVVRAES